nr:MAG TPA: hypothetical protein [Bacteriophage sp.]
MVTKEDKLTRQINGVGNKDIMPLPEKPCIYPIDILSSSLFPTSLNYPPCTGILTTVLVGTLVGFM